MTKKYLDALQLEFVKLCSQKKISILNHRYGKAYKKALFEDLFDKIMKSATYFKPKLVVNTHHVVTDLFFRLQAFQFDKSCECVIDFLGNTRASGPDKSSEKYKLIKIICNSISNFKVVAKVSSSYLISGPSRSPPQVIPVTPLFTPTNKRTRKVMEEN